MMAVVIPYMRFKSMTILSIDKIENFKDRLFKKDISRLMQRGTDDLKPLSTCELDDNGNIIIIVDKIVDFFFQAVEKDELLNSDTHISNLYALFEVFSKGAEAYSFKSDVRVSEKRFKKQIIKPPLTV